MVTRQLHDYYLAVLSGRQRGVFAGLVVVVLIFCSWAYRLALLVRNGLMVFGRPKSLGVPVVSVGNITAGGTGKTPAVLKLAELLGQAGRKVGVISRGYKGGDEALMLADKLPEAHVFASRDRFAAGQQAINEAGCDVLVLDDAFHKRRQLKRELDVVMVNTLDPFGHGRLLPAGLLREPVSGLAAADIILLGNCDQCSEEQLATIELEVSRHNSRAELFRCRYAFTSLRNHASGARQARGGLAGKRVVALCGIGSPDSFLGLLEGSGAEVAGRAIFPDHYLYLAADVEEIKQLAGPGGTIVTTEKDAVKLAPELLPGLLVVEVELVIEQAGRFEEIVLRQLRKV